MSDSLEAEIDLLFQEPRESFTKARDALAKRLRAAKHPDAAQRVKSLTKPSPSAWAINRLWWTARDELEALLDAAEHVRQAQARGDLERMRVAERERRRQHQGLLDRVQSFLGNNANVLRKVAVNLDALAAHGRARLPGEAGRWVEDLEAPGFDLLGPAIALVPALVEPLPSSRDDEARRAAQARYDEAEQRVAQAERSAAAARTACEAALAEEQRAIEAARRAQLEAERATELRGAADDELERALGLIQTRRQELDAAQAGLRELED